MGWNHTRPEDVAIVEVRVDVFTNVLLAKTL
jgi:hypothetical protein